MGVSPISLKKNRCSRHFRPMERSAGSRRSSFANLDEASSGYKLLLPCWWERERGHSLGTDTIPEELSDKPLLKQLSNVRLALLWCVSELPALLIGVFLFAVSLQRSVYSLPQQLHFTGVGQTLGICR